MTPSTTQQTKAERLAAIWNRHYPVGTEVNYFATMMFDEAKRTKTRSEAYALSGHTPVVMLEGVSGCVDIGHCRPIVERPTISH